MNRFYNARGGYTPTEKHPIGLKPKWLHDQQRQIEIMDAMMRYLKANKKIPQEWMDELYKLSS